MPEFMNILENDRYDNAYVDTKGDSHDISYEFLDEYLFNDDCVDEILCNMIDAMHETSILSKPYPNIPMYTNVLEFDVNEMEDEEHVLIVQTEE